MAKTELTRAIESALRSYHPTEVCGRKINKFRPSHTAYEVPVICGTTKGGIVDCMRDQEYFSGIRREGYCYLKEYRDRGKTWAQAMEEGFNCPRGFAAGEKPQLCDEQACRFRYIREVGHMDVLVTCYEIKVTKSDFKSTHGHNFVGNANYYVVPKELYPDIVDLVPEDIGIILYLSAGSYIGLRKKKECTFKPLDEEQQKWFILSTLKRLEDTAWGAALTRGDCRTCVARDTCQKTVTTKEPPGGVQIITGCSAYITHPEERLW